MKTAIRAKKPVCLLELVCLCCLVTFTGCENYGSYLIRIVFPDDEARARAGQVHLVNIFPNDPQANCQVLMTGAAEPGDEGYPVEYQATYDLSQPGASWGLKVLITGPHLFFAEVRDLNGVLFLRGCTSANVDATGTKADILLESAEETCHTDGDCPDDGLWCNGEYQCQEGSCALQERDCTHLADNCNQGDCDEESVTCIQVPIDPGVEESILAGNCADLVDNDCDDETDASDPDCRCTGNEDCGDGLACLDGECVVPDCTFVGFECPAGETCVEGACCAGEDCSVDNQCATMVCQGTEFSCGYDSSEGMTAWVRDTTCIDMDPCTVNDSCLVGVCQGEDMPCDAGEECVEGQCRCGQTGPDCSGAQSCCGVECVDLSTSLDHCGACDTPCARDNAVAACNLGACRIGSCIAGWGNCDTIDENGCEEPLTSLGHCGHCDVPCELDNASETCELGSCQILECDPGWDNCNDDPSDGCETWIESWEVNLVGRTVTVLGTACDDVYSCTRLAAQYTVNINGEEHVFSVDDVDLVEYYGHGGYDTVALNLDMYDEKILMQPPTYAAVHYPDWESPAQMTVNGASEVVIWGGLGFNQVRVYDTPGDDTFIGNDYSGTIFIESEEGYEYYYSAQELTGVEGFATGGGADLAKLWDGPGDDLCTLGPVGATGKMEVSVVGQRPASGVDFHILARHFEWTHVYGNIGGIDVAYMQDSPEDDFLRAEYYYVSIWSDSFSNQYQDSYYHRVKHFERVYATSDLGGDDTAYLDDSPGEDTFYADPLLTTLSGDYPTGDPPIRQGPYYAEALGFENVYSYTALGGGDDVANLFGSCGDDTYHQDPVSGITVLFGDGFYIESEEHETMVYTPCDNNECLEGTHSCDPNATCTNTQGSYMCSCNHGYSGDGFNCVAE